MTATAPTSRSAPTAGRHRIAWRPGRAHQWHAVDIVTGRTIGRFYSALDALDACEAANAATLADALAAAAKDARS